MMSPVMGWHLTAALQGLSQVGTTHPEVNEPLHLGLVLEPVPWTPLPLPCPSLCLPLSLDHPPPHRNCGKSHMAEGGWRMLLKNMGTTRDLDGPLMACQSNT